MLPTVLLCAAAYVVGSIPTGLLIGRARGVDVRAVGSGNIGTTNVARALGRRWAVLVLVLDALKGFAPLFVARHLLPHYFSARAAALGAFFAIVGQMFTIFLRGRGGKGVATSLGVAFGVSPAVALICFGMYGVGFSFTRLSSVGSLLGIWTSPILTFFLLSVPREFVALSVVNALLVTYRHRENLGRIARGEEIR